MMVLPNNPLYDSLQGYSLGGLFGFLYSFSVFLRHRISSGVIPKLITNQNTEESATSSQVDSSSSPKEDDQIKAQDHRSLPSENPEQQKPPKLSKSWFDMTPDERWQPSCLEMVAQIWSLSSVDMDSVWKMKEELHHDHDYQYCEDTSNNDDFQTMCNPLELARCYVDANRNISQAIQTFQATLKWRKEKNIDTILQRPPPPEWMTIYYPSCWLEGTDKDGDPIWLDRGGASDAEAFVYVTGVDRFIDYVLWVRENGLRGEFARAYELQHGIPPAQATVLLDMEGLCQRHMESALIPPLQQSIQQLQDYYGGLYKRILILRAPFLFRVVWQVAKHFCNPKMKRAIIFCNARNSQSTLDEYIDRAVLPPCICPTEGQGKPGPGYIDNLQGGIMPDDFVEPPPSMVDPQPLPTPDACTERTRAMQKSHDAVASSSGESMATLDDSLSSMSTITGVSQPKSSASTQQNKKSATPPPPQQESPEQMIASFFGMEL